MSNATDAEELIVRVIHRAHPDWEPPKDTGRTWIACLCPYHGDEHKSAAVSFEYDSFFCFVCEMGGDVIKVIRQKEGVSYSEAKSIAEGLAVGDSGDIPAGPAGITGRRLSSGTRSARTGGQPVRPGIRGRPR
jgi:hypothetical protein